MEIYKFGEPVNCPKCGEISFFPFYTCGKKCPLSITEMEKDELDKKLLARGFHCAELKHPCSEGIVINPTELFNHLEAVHQMKMSEMRVLVKSPKGSIQSIAFAFVAYPFPQQDLQHGSLFRWPARALKFTNAENTEILILNAVMETSNESKAHFWGLMADPKKCKDYKIRVTSKRGQSESPERPSPRISTSGGITAINPLHYYDFDVIKSRKDMVSVSADLLRQSCRPICGKKHAKYSTLRVEILKNC